MTIAERLRRWLDLSRLRSQVRRNPSPSAFADLAERLVAYGDVDRALRTAEDGISRFPHSERLAHVRLFAKRGRVAGRLRSLRDDVVRRPSPLVYSQLATLYRDLDQSDDALDTARECAERFPLNEGPWLIQGEIRLERFLRDIGARDAVLAEQSLRRVTRINARSTRAQLLLAELSWTVGDLSSCRSALRAVLEFAPDEPGVAAFARSLAPGSGEATTDSFADLAQLVEERRAFANPPESFPSARPAPRPAAGAIDLDVLRAEIARLGAEPHVLGSVVLDRAGAVVADASSGQTLGRRQLAELAGVLTATSDDASRRLDAGGLLRAEIEGPSGSVLVARVADLTLAVVYAAPLRGDRVWEMVQDGLARSAAAPVAEAAHA